MVIVEVKSNNVAGIFYFPVVASQLNTFGAKAPVFTFAQRESPACCSMASTTKSSVKPGVFSFPRRGSKEGDSKMVDEKVVRRFFSRIQKTKSCWLWLGYKDRSGYGQFSLNKKTHYAHRASYIIHYGSIPEGLDVLHKCDNPSCVNPAHLFPGTHQDNMDDRGRKGRHKPPIGEKHHLTKLTEAKVIEIRIRRQQGDAYKKLAKEYGVSVSSIKSIVNRTRWKHI